MTIRPTIKPRAKILVVGVGGVGKTNAALSIARRVTDGTFYVFDTDDSWDTLLATDYTDVAERGDYEITLMPDWDELVGGIEKANKLATPNDWLSLDSISPTWSECQDWFTQQIFGKDIAAYFLEVRKAKAEADVQKKALGAFDGWKDWPVINKQYARLYNAILKFPGHKFLTAEQVRIEEGDEKDKETMGLWGPYSIKAAGQKRLGHITSTVLMLNKTRVGSYTMTTIKDRGRPEMERVPVEDFAIDYLMNIAGWKMEKAT